MNHRLTVAHLLASNFFGGPEKQLIEHAQRITGKQFVPHIISFEEPGRPNQLLDKANKTGISTRHVKSRGPFDFGMIREICGYIRQEKIDLLCVHGYKANVVGRIASWITGIPLIAISRGWTGETTKVRCYEWLDKSFLRFADRIVAVSYGQKDKLVRLGIPEQRVTVIHNAINLQETRDPPDQPLRKQLKLPEDAIIIASAGRLSPEKNYAGMIEVAREVTNNNPKVFFMIFGEGFLRQELESKIFSAGLAGRFLLPGFRSDLQSVLNDIDVFILPSFTEGLPNVILEAFAVRKPVVATRVGGTPEVVEDGVCGFLALPHEISVMAKHLLALSENPALRQQMGTRGFERTQELFAFEQQTRLYEELYEQIAASRSR